MRPGLLLPHFIDLSHRRLSDPLCVFFLKHFACIQNWFPLALLVAASLAKLYRSVRASAHSFGVMSRAHADTSDPSSMLERMWHRNRSKWTHNWLGAAYRRNPETNQKQFVLGCYLCFVCGDFAAGNKFSKFSMSNWPFDAHLLDQHAATATHRRALGVLEARALAPSMPQFLKVLNAYRNKAGTRPVEDVARREKSRKMLFCLAESMRSADRAFLRKATVATISQDVRKSRLLIRFRAAYLDASGALQLRAGILGQTRVPEGGALNLCDATLRVCQEFCTIQQAPLSSKSAEGRLDGNLLERLLTIVQFFVADAASDEQAAST